MRHALLHRILLVALIFGLNSPVFALSCIGLSDKFFVKCTDNVCAIDFRVREIQASGGCARRTVVESVSESVATVILKKIPDQKSAQFFEIEVIHRYYKKLPETASQLNDSLSSSGLSASSLGIKTLSTETDLSQIKKSFEAIAFESQAKLVKWWIVEVLALLIGLFFLFRATKSIHQNIRNAAKSCPWKELGIQVFLFLASALMLFSQSWLILIGLLAPITILIWLIQLIYFVYSRYKR